MALRKAFAQVLARNVAPYGTSRVLAGAPRVVSALNGVIRLRWIDSDTNHPGMRTGFRSLGPLPQCSTRLPSLLPLKPVATLILRP